MCSVLVFYLVYRSILIFCYNPEDATQQMMLLCASRSCFVGRKYTNLQVYSRVKFVSHRSFTKDTALGILYAILYKG